MVYVCENGEIPQMKSIQNGCRLALAGLERVGRSGVPTQNLLRRAARGAGRSVGIPESETPDFTIVGRSIGIAELRFNLAPPFLQHYVCLFM